MFLFFFALALLGIILFFTIIFFYQRKDGILEPTANTDISIPEQTERRNEPAFNEPDFNEPAFNDENEYIPVMCTEKKIPGINKHELIHYIGSGILSTIDSLQDPSEIVLGNHELTTELEGNVALTLKILVIFNDKNVKKILIDSIGKYHFEGHYLVIKRKDVKKKKDVLELFDKFAEFKYIFNILMKK